MKIFRGGDVPPQVVDPRSFVGIAHVKRLADGQEGVPVIVYQVEFEPGSRTNWLSTGASGSRNGARRRGRWALATR
jgi:hypothetical protein